jgi:hypothetical protein
MIQNGPGTAPGSQGVFGAKGVGSEMGARQLFGSWCLSCPVAGTSAHFFFVCRKNNYKIFCNRIRWVILIQISKLDLIRFRVCELVRKIAKMVP